MAAPALAAGSFVAQVREVFVTADTGVQVLELDGGAGPSGGTISGAKSGPAVMIATTAKLQANNDNVMAAAMIGRCVMQQ